MDELSHLRKENQKLKGLLMKHQTTLEKYQEYIKFLENEVKKGKSSGSSKKDRRFHGMYKSRKVRIWIRQEHLELEKIRSIAYDTIEAFQKSGDTNKHRIYIIEIAPNEKISIGIDMPESDEFEKLFIDIMARSDENVIKDTSSKVNRKIETLWKEVRELRKQRDTVLKQNNVLRKKITNMETKIGSLERDQQQSRWVDYDDIVSPDRRIPHDRGGGGGGRAKENEYYLSEHSRNVERKLKREIVAIKRNVTDENRKTHAVFLCRYQKKYTNMIVKNDHFILEDLLKVKFSDVQAFQKNNGRTKTHYKFIIRGIGVVKLSLTEKRDEFETLMVGKIYTKK